MALNEEKPEKIDDHLEPDYKGMKKFDPVLEGFKDVFFDGNDFDPACGDASAKGRGRGRGGARGGKATAGTGRGRGKKIDLSDNEEEKK
mmetsp:Transcript_16149/g.15530  ORF Transcript_16149/g.15530 Transcript_16149/m.15530 type:complete len:89 (-) Transcript_16149:431-697(-)